MWYFKLYPTLDGLMYYKVGGISNLHKTRYGWGNTFGHHCDTKKSDEENVNRKTLIRGRNSSALSVNSLL